MKLVAAPLPGVVVVEPELRRDERGFFLEVFHAKKFEEQGLAVRFVQDNHSQSRRGTLRGLHTQLGQPQGKLVRCVRGEIFDVAVDARRGSPHFGRWFGTPLSAENFRQLWIPPDFLHGFAVVSDVAEVEYKCTDFWAPGCEITVAWNDPALGIAWPVAEPILSPKDAAGRPLADYLDRLPRHAG